MIGIDTNVLARYVTRDDPEQAETARRFLDRLTGSEPGYVAGIVLCELVWVLKGAQGYDRPQIVQMLRRLLNATELQFENRDAVVRALDAYETGPADFAAYLIAETNLQAGARHTVTFDRAAATHSAFKLLQ